MRPPQPEMCGDAPGVSSSAQGDLATCPPLGYVPDVFMTTYHTTYRRINNLCKILHEQKPRSDLIHVTARFMLAMYCTVGKMP